MIIKLHTPKPATNSCHTHTHTHKTNKHMPPPYLTITPMRYVIPPHPTITPNQHTHNHHTTKASKHHTVKTHNQDMPIKNHNNNHFVSKNEPMSQFNRSTRPSVTQPTRPNYDNTGTKLDYDIASQYSWREMLDFMGNTNIPWTSH